MRERRVTLKGGNWRWVVVWEPTEDKRHQGGLACLVVPHTTELSPETSKEKCPLDITVVH